MKKAKYNIGDKVWRIRMEKAEEKEIHGLIMVKGKGFGYWLSPSKDFCSTPSWPNKEDSLFPSKEALIKSL